MTSHEIMIPYSIEQVSKTKWQGKIYLPGGRTLELDPTTKGRCAKRLCTRLMPLLVKKIEATWPDELDKPLTDKDIEERDLPETTAAARDRQLESLPPDTGVMDEMADRKFPPPSEETHTPQPRMYHPGENAD